MGRDETLGGDRDLVVYEWTYARQKWRVSFVQGIARLSTEIRGEWYMIALRTETAAILHLYVSAFTFNLRVQAERAEALALAATASGKASHWRKVARKIRDEIAQLPEPWNSRGAKR